MGSKIGRKPLASDDATSVSFLIILTSTKECRKYRQILPHSPNNFRIQLQNIYIFQGNCFSRVSCFILKPFKTILRGELGSITQIDTTDVNNYTTLTWNH